MDEAKFATASYKRMRQAIAQFPDVEYVPVQTSIGSPRYSLGYEIAYKNGLLAPYGAFKVTEVYDEFRELYVARLEAKAGEIVDRFGEYIAANPGRTIALLCHEDLSPAGLAAYRAKEGEDNWCHRSMFTEWFHGRTGIEIPELDVLVDTSKEAASAGKPKSKEAKEAAEVASVANARKRKVDGLIGGLEVEHGEDTLALVMIARNWDRDQWADLAKKHGINRPSDTTIKLVLEALEERLSK